MEKKDLRYEVDDTNTVRVWVSTQEEPFILQPHWPVGDLFETTEDAIAWAEAKIAEITDIEAPQAPNYKNEPPQKNYMKIVEEQKQIKEAAIKKLISLGLTEEQAKAIAG